VQLEKDLLETQSFDADVGAEPIREFTLPFIPPAGEDELHAAAIPAL
jgi:hypothetical protein